MDKRKEYELIREFMCNGKQMVIIRIKNCVHTMPLDEWKRTYGKLHPERWNKAA